LTNYFLKACLGVCPLAVFGLNLYLSANFLKNSFNDTLVSLQEFFNKFAQNLKIYPRKSRSGRPLAKLLGFCFSKKFCRATRTKFFRRRKIERLLKKRFAKIKFLEKYIF
jgi:hypothetical protein